MARFVLTAEARKDLDEIWQYIAAESEIAADKVIAHIIRRFPRLAEFPPNGAGANGNCSINAKFSCWSIHYFL